MFLDGVSELFLHILDLHLRIHSLLFQLDPPLLDLSNGRHSLLDPPAHLIERPLQLVSLVLTHRQLVLQVHHALLVVMMLPHCRLHRLHLVEVLVALDL